MENNFGKLEVFDKIYSESYWGNGSGGGSSPKATRPYKKFLENFINEFNITSIVDLGCGDWQFSQFINFGEAEYLGIDAAKTVINSNSSRFSNEKISFMHLPKNYEEIPKGDLFLCKDVLQHLSSEEIIKISKIFPKFKYCLITNDVMNASKLGKFFLRIKQKKFDIYNPEIKIGDYRELDLTKKPFCFKMKKVFEWDILPYSLWKTLNLKNLILGRKCEWKKRTYLYK